MVDCCIFVVLLNLNPLITTTGWDGEERIGIGPTRAATETRGSTGGRSDWWVRPLSCFNFSALLLILLLSDLPLFLQSTPTGEAGWGVSDAGGTTYRSHPPPEVGGATGVYSVIFVCYSPLLFFSLILFFVVSFFSRRYQRAVTV